METFHSDLFMNLFAFFSADNASDFNNSAQSISVVLSHLSLSGYAIPLEGAAVGILLFLSTYIMLEHNLQLLSQEKFRLAVGHGSLGTHTFGVIKKQFGRHNKEQYT